MIVGTCELKTTFDEKELYDKLTNEYIMIHRHITDVVNEKLSKWNQEWDAIHPELIGKPLNEGSKEWDEYGKFIAAKEHKICEIFNEQLRSITPLRMACYSKNGTPQIIGRLNFWPGQEFYIEW